MMAYLTCYPLRAGFGTSCRLSNGEPICMGCRFLVCVCVCVGGAGWWGRGGGGGNVVC